MQNRIKQIANVQTNLGENLPSAKSGGDLLQVWTNILANACDAIKDLHKEGMGLIDISSRLDDGKVVVEISNEGNAIPDETMMKMFDPFYTTKRVGKGTGLGLSICREILKKWGGTIVSRNGNGRVTFEVALPLTANLAEVKIRQEECLLGN